MTFGNRLGIGFALLSVSAALAGCSKLPSEYQGKFACSRLGVFEITGTSVRHTERSGRPIWNVSIDRVEAQSDWKLVYISGEASGYMRFKSLGSDIAISDGHATFDNCRRM